METLNEILRIGFIYFIGGVFFLGLLFVVLYLLFMFSPLILGVLAITLILTGQGVWSIPVFLLAGLLAKLVEKEAENIYEQNQIDKWGWRVAQHDRIQRRLGK